MSALEWHISGSRLRDGTALPPDGETLRMDGKPELCMRGYHACLRLIDALRYSTGSIICRIRLSGTIIHDTDKMVASERTIMWRINGEALLHRFARRCALDVIHLWETPEIVRRYLRTGDELLKAAAWDAAGNAGDTASVAVRAAAREAAEGAALATAGNVAAARAGETTACAAAGEAALAATGGTALATAGNAAAALAGEAAVRAAAWHAAKDAARTKQNRWLVAMVAAERRLRELPRDALPSDMEPA